MDEDKFILSAEYFISGFCFKYSSETIAVSMLMALPVLLCSSFKNLLYMSLLSHTTLLAPTAG